MYRPLSLAPPPPLLWLLADPSCGGPSALGLLAPSLALGFDESLSTRRSVGVCFVASLLLTLLLCGCGLRVMLLTAPYCCLLLGVAVAREGDVEDDGDGVAGTCGGSAPIDTAQRRCRGLVRRC